MTTLNDDELSAFKRLAIRVRKTAVDIEKTHEVVSKAQYREAVRNIYQQVSDFVGHHPEFKYDFRDLPQDVGNGHPLSFTGDLNLLRTFIDVVEDTIITSSPSQPPSEFIIQPGQAFTASKIIENILQQASSDIKITDNFMSEASVQAIETANRQRNISIITKNPDPKFISAIKIAKTGWKGQMEVRESTAFHDRYLILDDTSVWMCGPSLDYLGVKKPGVIVQIEETPVLQAIIGLFNSTWQKASRIV